MKRAKDLAALLSIYLAEREVVNFMVEHITVMLKSDLHYRIPF